MNWVRHSPPDTGGVAAPSRIKMRSHRSGADGVVGIAEVFGMRFLEEAPFSTTPSAPLKEASRLLLEVASSPPVSGGEWRAAQFIHTFYDRAYSRFRRFATALVSG